MTEHELAGLLRDADAPTINSERRIPDFQGESITDAYRPMARLLLAAIPALAAAPSATEGQTPAPTNEVEVTP